MQMYAHVNKGIGKWLINLKNWQKAQLILQRGADRLILVTKEAKQYAIESEGINGAKIFVVPNTVKKNFDQELVLSEKLESKFNGKFCILYFGDTALRRGTDNIIQSISRLKKMIPNIHAILVGKGSEDDILIKMAEELGVSSYVSFEGWQDVSLMRSYANVSSIGICPFKRNLHHDTTYANKLFQFMGLKLPILASDCNAQVNVLEKYNCGIVYKAEDIDEMSDKILWLYNNKSERGKLGENGYNAISKELNWEKTSRQLVELYNSFNWGNENL